MSGTCLKNTQRRKDKQVHEAYSQLHLEVHVKGKTLSKPI